MAKKLKPQKPDEAFSKGPFTVARFGKNVVFEANWQDREFDEYQKHLVENYPKIIEEIDILVSEIKNLIKGLPPEKLLQRAWWEKMMVLIKTDTEDEIGEEDPFASHMIDYVQSVIAAVPPAENLRDDVTDEEWGLLGNKIEHLFRKIGTD